MIRNLKVLIAAAMALAAFGALSATAHAAEEKFHCNVEPCTATLLPDETAGTTTAHHVFVVKGKTPGGAEGTVSFTCNQLTGEATSKTETSTELTFTNLVYENSAAKPEDKCKIGASEIVTVDFTECDYLFKSTGGATDSATVSLQCPPGHSVHITVGGTTCLTVTPFSNAKGLGYHDAAAPNKEIVTATANVTLPAGSVDVISSTGNCAAVGLASVTTATYTTGNTLVTGETDVSEKPVMKKVWFE